MIRASTLERVLLVLSDFLALTICFVLAYWVQFHSGWIADKFDPSKTLDQYWSLGVGLNIGWLLLFSFAGLYRSWLLMSRTHQILRVLRAVVIGIVLVIVCLFGSEFISKFSTNMPLSEGYLYGSRFPWIFIYGGLAMVLVAGFRMLIYLCLRGLLRMGYGANNILVLGATEAGRKVAEDLKNTPALGQRVVGFVDERFQVLDREFAGFPVLGKYADLPALVKKYKVTGIVIAHESSSPQEIMRVLVWICELQLHIYIVPELYSVVNGRFKANLVYGFELQELFAFTMPPWQVRVKRIMDLVVGGFIGLVSFPLWVFAAIAIKLQDGGPIFYSQERIGLYGKPFTVYKFRTMRTDAESDGIPRLENERNKYLTPFGGFLRAHHLDELPQLWNVLKGDMSFVGPRPERQYFIDQINRETDDYRYIYLMRPGVTSYATIFNGYTDTMDKMLKRLEYDLDYLDNRTIFTDLGIILRTAFSVFSGKKF